MSRRIPLKSSLGLALFSRPRSAAEPALAPQSYPAFEKIDGRHPWQASVPEGFVAYPVRQLNHGKVTYFNFALAREMGLIAKNHRDEMTPELEEKILQTFCIQILNEYDQANGVRPNKNNLKPHPYMATRYLQLQHASKRGTTSGDGRSIWNGIFKSAGQTWDISSRGTGVTCLAPGAVQANRPLQTGDVEHGYGCGLADLTELIGSAVMSEIFHLNGVGTERVLTIIDVGRGCGIGVRAAPNLIRPAHLFLFLKQGRLDPLRRAVDYLIERQATNGEWKINPFGADRYQALLKEMTQSFARFAAMLERQYIFAWLDWDGDNVLANAGIIDYGSIRQFGLRHDQYRYDDVQRFSTNLNEQRGKARSMLQVFVQMVDFLETGKRKPLEELSKSPALKNFDREYDFQLRRMLLQQVGLSEKQSDLLLKANGAVVENFYRDFLALERIKTRAPAKRLPDGINRAAVFNLRKLLRELPSLLYRESREGLQPEEILRLMASANAKKSDLKLRGGLRAKIVAFQKSYLRLLRTAAGAATARTPLSASGPLRELKKRAYEANRPGRITGNASEFVVEAIMRAKKRAVCSADIQKAVDLFVCSQVPADALAGRNSQPVSLTSEVGKLFQELVNIAHEFEEDI